MQPGFVLATYDYLVEVFGVPTLYEGKEIDKITAEWIIPTDRGDIRIYDYATGVGKPPKHPFNWHVNTIDPNTFKNSKEVLTVITERSGLTTWPHLPVRCDDVPSKWFDHMMEDEYDLYHTMGGSKTYRDFCHSDIWDKYDDVYIWYASKNLRGELSPVASENFFILSTEPVMTHSDNDGELRATEWKL
jgi:hypothetical protein